MAPLTCWLDRRHPRYKALLAHWLFVIESYDGSPDWFNSDNLPRYASELPAKYRKRVASATRDNYTREVVDQHSGYLFQTLPTRQVAQGHRLADWWPVAAQTGSMDDVAAEADQASALCGRCVVVVEKPATLATSAADDPLPYAFVLAAPDLLDYAWGADGRLDWVLTAERRRLDADPMATADGVEDVYRLRTREGWALFAKRDGKAVELERGTWRADGTSLGRVPVVLLDHARSGNRYSPRGLADEIARLDRLVAQEDSSLHEVVTWQGAPTLMFPGRADKPLELGTAAVLTYPEQAKNPPGFLSPDAAFIATLQDRLEKRIDRIRELANLPTRAGGKASGESKLWDSKPLTARLSKKAQALQRMEVEVAQIVDLFLGGDGEPAGLHVQYPNTFDVSSLEQDVGTSAALDAMPGAHSPTFRVLLAQRLAHKALPDLPPETQTTIDEEIRAGITAGDSLPDDHADTTDDGADPEDQQDQQQDEGQPAPGGDA